MYFCFIYLPWGILGRLGGQGIVHTWTVWVSGGVTPFITASSTPRARCPETGGDLQRSAGSEAHVKERNTDWLVVEQLTNEQTLIIKSETETDQSSPT